jgi:hypothetical protein
MDMAEMALTFGEEGFDYTTLTEESLSKLLRPDLMKVAAGLKLSFTSTFTKSQLLRIIKLELKMSVTDTSEAAHVAQLW